MKSLSICILLVLVSSNCFCQTASDYSDSGVYYLEIGDDIKTEYFLLKSLELDTQTIGTKYLAGNAYINLGWIRAKNKDYDNALFYYSKLTEIDNPYYVTAFYRRGFIKKQIGDSIGAILDFNKVVELNYKEKVMYRSVQFTFETENLKIMINEYDKFISKQPFNAELYHNRGFYKNALKDYDQAIKDFTKAIEIDSSIAEYYHSRAEAYEALGNKKDACFDYKKSIDLGYSERLHAIEDYCK